MKKFSLTSGILRRPITVIMLTIIIIGFGIYSLKQLRVTLYPSINIPVLAISTGFQNVAPEDIDRLLVMPLEGAISAVEGIETLEARIRKGSAFIILRLQESVDIRKTELRVREAIDQVRGELPEAATEPVIFQFDPENRPIMKLSIRSKSRGLDELRNLGLELIEPRLERLKGLASAETQGGLERRIYLDVSPMRLAQHQLLPADIENALRSNNVQLPIGDIIGDKVSYSVRAISTFQTVDEIGDTIVKMSENGIPLRVKDVAIVENGFSEITSLIKVNGEEAVTMDIQKASDANTLDVVNSVKASIEGLNDVLPPGVVLEILSNEGKIIEDSINNLAQSAVAALFVVVVVIFLFMGGLRISLVVASSIPISICATFTIMFAYGLTLNIFTLSALALAIGLLVDNAIVVTESIARNLEEGMPKFKAALQGTNEVLGALLGSSLTTLGVFVPITLLTGFQGAIFREFALTISFAIAISFIASIVVVPVLALLALKDNQFQKQNVVFRGIKKLSSKYSDVLRWFLLHKWVSAVTMVTIIASVVFMLIKMDKEGFPESDSGELEVSIRMPEGTKLNKTAGVIEAFTAKIMEYEEVTRVVSSIGKSRYTEVANRGSIDVILKPEQERTISSQDMALRLREALEAPGATVNVSVEGGGVNFGGGYRGGNRSLRLSLIGPDVEELIAISTQIEDKLSPDPNVLSVSNGRADPTPELLFVADRNRIGRLGTNVSTIAGAMRTQTLGNQAGFFISEGREVPIEVRTQKKALTSREDLFDLEVFQLGEQRIPVLAVGDFIESSGLDSYSKRDRQIVLDVNIQVNGSPDEYRAGVINFLENEIVLPDGVRFDFTGSSRDLQAGLKQFGFAGLASIVLMFMIMAALFENFRDPFVIWLCIFIALFGALVFLILIGTALSTTAIIGLFMLVGIIVNNGIVLVDYMHIYTKDQAYDEHLIDKVLEACRRRMRPVILTALTTICSMVPLAIEFGSGSEIWSPLAKAVIGGLFFGTFLTLFVVPSLVMGITKERRAAMKLAANKG